MGILFLADQFSEQYPGGAELSDEALIRRLLRHTDVIRVNTREATPGRLEKYRQAPILIGNASHLSNEARQWLIESKSWFAIIEHDHHYLKSRNPCLYLDFTAPQEELSHVDFYQAAQLVICQTYFHESVMRRSINQVKTWVLECNFWHEEWFPVFSRLRREADRQSLAAAQDSAEPVKNTEGALAYCKQHDLPCRLMPKLAYPEFIQLLARNQHLVFMPLWIESFSRITAEAMMLGLNVIGNQNIGLLHEPWLEDLRSKYRVRPGFAEALTERLRTRNVEATDILLKMLP